MMGSDCASSFYHCSISFGSCVHILIALHCFYRNMLVSGVGKKFVVCGDRPVSSVVKRTLSLR